MSTHFTRVRLQREGQPETVCWEMAVDDRVVSYLAADKSPICEPNPALRISYVSREMVADPWAPPAAAPAPAPAS